MNPLWRVVDGEHIENETNRINGRAITLEWEFSATISFITMSNVSSTDNLDILKRICKSSIHFLQVQGVFRIIVFLLN